MKELGVDGMEINTIIVKGLTCKNIKVSLKIMNVPYINYSPAFNKLMLIYLLFY